MVLIDQLSSQYVPVLFAHKLHAQMTEMSGGCALCHHYNPSHEILRCRECHDAAGPQDLAKPSLKGAYHRQCLNCHREWSHETECAVCHAKKTADSVAIKIPDPTDIMGMLHPNAEEPVQKRYETKYEHGRLVTFRHQDHVKRFGFKCVSCHRAQNCNHCHKPEKAAVPTKTFTEHHSPCAGCHETAEDKKEKCAHCHSDKEIPAFSHEKTGLVLDKDHQDAACVDCHVGSKFDKKPICSECHEEKENITYPEKLPGTKLKTP
ncbi:MAG: cytochrome c3 family protein [Verrucomicrobiota bacterium]